MSALRLSPDLAAWAELAAALVNTRPRATDPPEKLGERADLERLLAACPEAAPAPRQRDVGALRELRPRLLAAFEADRLDALAEALNPLLATRWELGPAPAGGWALGPAPASQLADWFGPRAARGLAELALAYGIERLHLCRSDDCLRAVVDVSRNGTRHYCSRTCANRESSRRHRLRR